MKRLVIVVLSVAMIGFSGCRKVTAPTPVAPGYTNSVDQSIGQIINAGTDFYRTIQCEQSGQNYSSTTRSCVADSSVTAITLSPSELSAFNAFGLALNTAKVTYAAYHAGTATLAQAQAAANDVQQQQQALQPVIKGVK